MSRFFEALREAGQSIGKGGAAEVQPQSAPPIQGDSIPEEVKPQAEEHALGAATEPVRVVSPAAVLEPGAEPEELASEEGARPTFTAKKPPKPLRFDPNTRVIPNAAKPVVLEQYRKLRTKVLQQFQVRRFRTLAITSPGPKEGKTTTALNLALSFSMLPNYRVLVVDGDVRRGSAGAYLGADRLPGLSNVIDGSARLEDVILQYEECAVHVLLRGNSPVPPELLFSAHIERHFRKMGEMYDLVIVDTPPVNLIADSQIIAAKCDAVLLVARAFSTTRKSLDKALHELSGMRIIGTVLNSGTKAQVYRGYGGYY